MTNGKAVFLDRDGTLIRNKNYLSRPADIEWFADTFPALLLMREKGYRLILITNQSGVGRGFFTMKEVNDVHGAMARDLREAGVGPFDAVGVCPHAPHENCGCRKPSPRMVEERLGGLEPAACWMVGDKELDAQCGLNAGVHGAVVREKGHAGPHPYFATLLDFARSLP